MRAEAEPAEFVFVTADAVPAVVDDDLGLVVVDRAHELADAQAAAVQRLRPGRGGPPLLAVTGRADPQERPV